MSHGVKQRRIPSGLVSNHTQLRSMGMTNEQIEENERMWYTEQEESEYRSQKFRERFDALKTMFPRAHGHIDHLDQMVDIARADQLNPLYERVLKEFDEAKLAMSRAANKLAQAVKLTDSEKLEERTSVDFTQYRHGGIGINGTMGVKGSMGTVGTNGPMGPMGMPGPPGPMGPQGPKTTVDEIKAIIALANLGK
jgi:hypothetical protein